MTQIQHGDGRTGAIPTRRSYPMTEDPKSEAREELVS